MTDLDAAIRLSIEQSVPRRDPNWADVVTRARGTRRARRPLVAIAIAAAALVVGAAAVAETIGHGFSDWLEGSPGTPASSADTAELRNGKSFSPLDPKLDVRELLRTTYAGRVYRLVGFRTGGAVCLRLVQAAIDEGGDVACVPGDQLARSHDLAVPLAVDKPLTDPGAGGVPGPKASFGLVAAEARHVVLDGDGGPHEAESGNGAFLVIDPGGRTTLSGYAIDDEGERRAIPVAPALGREIGQFHTGLPLLGPSSVDRTVSGGSIGWLQRREPRGQAVPDDLARILRPHPRPSGMPATMPGPTGLAPGDFARLIKPDDQDFVRMVIGRASGGVCYALVARGGVGMSCAPVDVAFRKWPFSPGWEYAGAGAQLLTVAGIASDDVAQLQIYLGDGDVLPVALRDNAFFARVQRAKLPARLVARDGAGRVIGLMSMRAM